MSSTRVSDRAIDLLSVFRKYVCVTLANNYFVINRPIMNQMSFFWFSVSLDESLVSVSLVLSILANLELPISVLFGRLGIGVIKQEGRKAACIDVCVCMCEICVKGGAEFS